MEQIKGLNTQSPATKNQISNVKPDVIKNANILTGYLANSTNGGILKPIAYVPVMAGTKILDYRLRMNLRLITPKTPAYQKLKATFKCYFVPNSRVWTNAEKFTAQKGGATEIKIAEEPNFGGKILEFTLSQTENPVFRVITDTDIWRDSWISTYLPRYQTGASDNTIYVELPKVSALPARGFKAIYNDYERNKEYDIELQEFKDDTVSQAEYKTIMPSMTSLDDNVVSQSYYKRHNIRGKRQNSYYTDYRTELLGQELEFESGVPTENQVLNYNETQKLIAEARSQAENAQLNDWDIIAKIRGSRKLTQGKVQLLGTKTVGLNYVPVTQDTYNTNTDIEKDFQELGQQGAFSYTEIDISMCNTTEIIEEGYLHIIMQVSADTVFETGFERTQLNVKWSDKYRPDLKDLKEDVLYEIEKSGTRINSAEDLTKITGFKRKFNEYFKLPNCLNGDCLTAGYYITDNSGSLIVLDDDENLSRTIPKRSFQFFEQDDKETNNFLPKNIWQDYTDVLINENQATTQEIESKTTNGINGIRIKGDNQIFFIGAHALIADLPIDENIKNNYTKWGET